MIKLIYPPLGARIANANLNRIRFKKHIFHEASQKIL